MLAPSWFPISVYEFGSWARATVVAMTVLLTKKPVCPVPESACIDELYPVGRQATDYSIPRPKELFSWRRFSFQKMRF